MSFIYRILIYQSIIAFCVYSLFFSKVKEESMNFKDDLMQFFGPSLNVISGHLDKFIPFIYRGILILELVFAILAIFGLKLFGFFEGVLILLHGIIKYNPFTEANQFQYIYGLQFEFLLVLGLFFSIMVSLTGSMEKVVDKEDEIEKGNEGEKKTTKIRDNSQEKNKNRSPSPNPKPTKRKME